MRFFHLSDLHLGKRVNEFSMIEDQKYILGQITCLAAQHRPDGVLIAGDVYDKTMPSAEAVLLFDGFLNGLSRLDIPVFIIAGNHDSAERLAFGAGLMRGSGVYLSPVFNGGIEPVTLYDRHGAADIWLVPFLRPSQVRAAWPELKIESYNDALDAVISHMRLDPSRRNILVAHQFVTGAVRCDSEELSVGGLDNVDAGLFDGFDYVALGHIHGPQTVGRDGVRYCGSPLKYSFSEAAHQKSIPMPDLGEKGSLAVRLLPLQPMRDMIKLRGTFDDICAMDGAGRQDYVQITLLDQEDVPNAIGRLRAFYPNIMRLEYDNIRTRAESGAEIGENRGEKGVIELFGDLYRRQNGRDIDDRQRRYLQGLVDEIWGEGQ